MLGTLVHATIPVQQNSLTAPEGMSQKTKLSEWDARECTAVGPFMSMSIQTMVPESAQRSKSLHRRDPPE